MTHNRKMRIGIDYRLAQKNTRGMGKYIGALVDELKSNTRYEWYLICDREPSKGFDPGIMNLIVSKKKNYLSFEQFSLPSIARKYRLDLLWCPANTFPLLMPKRCNLIVTLHDTIFMRKDLKEPVSLYQWIGKQYRKFVCQIGIRKVKILLTDSYYSQGEISRLLGRPDAVYAPVRIKLDGVSCRHAKDGKEADILRRLNIGVKAYMFTVSGDTPSKNLDFLLQCYRKSALTMPLVVGGVSAERSIDKYKRLYGDSFIFTGYLSESDLYSLYMNANGFLFLSLAEGFGIPLLEAMSYGIPIISSNVTSIPEVVGDGGIKVDPHDAEGLISLLNDFELLSFTDMFKAQEGQVKYYSDWKKTADIVIQEINKVAPDE